MAVHWQLKVNHHIQRFIAVPLDSYVSFDLLSAGSSVPGHTLQWSTIFFDIISYRHDFPKKYCWSKMCILFSLQIFSEIFPIIRNFDQKISQKYP